MTAALPALECLSRHLRALRVPHAIAGSVASSFHGLARTTADADVIVAIPPAAISRVSAALEPDFHLDAESISSAFRAGRSANIFYKHEFYKVDLFPLSDDAFDEAQIDRAADGEVEWEGKTFRLPFVSPEDVLLSKLRWWRACGGSEKQWEDMRGVVKISGPKLDLPYLRNWAAKMKLAEPLERLLALGDSVG